MVLRAFCRRLLRRLGRVHGFIWRVRRRVENPRGHVDRYGTTTLAVRRDSRPSTATVTTLSSSVGSCVSGC